MAFAWSVVLLQGAQGGANANLAFGPWLPSVQRSISTYETFTIEICQWETSANGGPYHSELSSQLAGQRWRRGFELTLTDVDQDPREPGSRTGRVFESAVDSFTRMYGEPSTGPKDALWSFHGWPEHLALELVKRSGDAESEYIKADEPTVEPSAQRLDSLRGDCALGGLARRIAEQGSASAVVQVEPKLLRDILFPGGGLFEIEFALPEDLARTDPEIWYEPWPCWEYVGRSALFGGCRGTIELKKTPAGAPRDGDRTRPEPHGLTVFAMTVRVQCRTDSSDMAQAQKERYRNEPRRVHYEGRIDTTYALDGELVFDGMSSVVRSVRLAGPVTIADSLEAMRYCPDTLSFCKARGTFRATGTLEHNWSTRPGR
jgi:hypothetical protein